MFKTRVSVLQSNAAIAVLLLGLSVSIVLAQFVSTVTPTQRFIALLPLLTGLVFFFLLISFNIKRPTGTKEHNGI